MIKIRVIFKILFARLHSFRFQKIVKTEQNIGKEC